MIWFWLPALLALAADVLTKWLTVLHLGDSLVQLGSLLHLRQTHNTGMALGIFAGSEWAGLILPLTAVLGEWLLMRRYRTTPFTLLACGLVTGGFIGNYGQRLLQGYVLDMIFFPWMPWFVCNAADIFICGGVALLAVSLLFRPDDWIEKASEAKDAENGNHR